MDSKIRVVLTGGEPLLQVDDSLITALKKYWKNIYIAIETNGTLKAQRVSLELIGYV